ncbi:TPA: hypothetical protein R2I11_004208 [Bacillus cereus]|nr:hypothetical protein [Bacillus cereus]
MNNAQHNTYFSRDKTYRDRLRILLILYFFSKEASVEEKNLGYARIFKSEVRIQKIDFLIRYPDYLAFELLILLDNISDMSSKEQIKRTVKKIFITQEPEIRRNDMQRYFFGAYEDIDDIIAFLVCHGFVIYQSKKSIDGRVFDKIYYLTELAVQKIEQEILNHLDKATWYKDRCELINLYFGNLSGTDLKIRQYQHEEYKNTPINQYIKGIQDDVRAMFKEIFEEEL